MLRPEITSAKFSVGDIVHHQLFGYRGVIIDVDATFQLADEWYENVARSKPPKDEPWYHVLVHEAFHSTYVAERNLEPDASGKAINHPALSQIFSRMVDGRYINDAQIN